MAAGRGGHHACLVFLVSRFTAGLSRRSCAFRQCHFQVGRSQMTHTMEQVRLDEMRGAPVYDSSGDKIGNVEEIFYDTESSRPEWIGIGFFGTKRVLVPVEGASLREDGICVAYPKDQVKDSPDIDGDEISSETESDLYRYYGIGGGSDYGGESGT